MTNSKRTNSPAPTPAVPWAVPGHPQDRAGQTEENDLVEKSGLVLPPAEAEPQAIVNEPTPPLAENLKSLFAPPPTHGKSVFAPPPKPMEKEPEPEFSMEGAPSWAELVKFVQAHGKVILQVRYPRPMGEAIDTLWRGVTVIKHDGTQVRHEKYGWIDWKDAIY